MLTFSFSSPCVSPLTSILLYQLFFESRGKARHLRRKDGLVIHLRGHLRSQLRCIDVYTTRRCHGGMVYESRCWFQALRWWERKSCSHKGAVESKVRRSYMGEMVSSEDMWALMHVAEWTMTFGTIFFTDAPSCLGFPDFFETQLLRFNLDFLAAHAETASGQERRKHWNTVKQTRLCTCSVESFSSEFL